MNRRQLEEAIAKACEVVGQSPVIVVGSQAILASFDDAQLPARATMSTEADIAPERDVGDHLSNELWIVAGQDSEWANERDFYIDAVSADTALLPEGWRDRARLIEVGRAAGLCPEAHDLCASKLARNEVKDREFVEALVDAGLVDARRIRNRLDEITDERLDPARKRVARQFVIALERRGAR
ncbi:MAG: hypothetical protein J0G30_12500 [Actinomycetales bacterium]|nr:hypothetical protein [Actinomycetales bacterium]